MLSAVKISELPLHPKSTDPDFIDLDHIIPVLGKSGEVWTTYRAPLSAAVPAINITAIVTSVLPTDPATVNIVPGAYRNSYELDFEIPQGRVPILTGGNVNALPPGATLGDQTVVFVKNTNPAIPFDYAVDFNLLRGAKGDKGDIGIGIRFKGFRDTKAELNLLDTLTPSPCLGDAWFVKKDESVMTTASSDVFYIRSLSGAAGSEIATWVAGGSGLKGPQGDKGDQGDFVNFTSITVSPLPENGVASVLASGPATNKSLVFNLPRGLSGVSPILSATVLSATFGTPPTVTDVGTQQYPTFQFTIPQGPTGLQGLSGITPTVAVGSVSALSAGSTPIVRPAASSGLGNLTIDFGIPMGRTPVVMVGSVSALSAGATPIVQTTTSSDNLSSTLSFGIPVGRAATVALATPPAVSATFTAQPSVVNLGSLSAAELRFVIPQGAPGDWTTPQTIVLQTTNFTVDSTHVGKIVKVNGSGAITITLPNNPTGIQVGQKIDFINMANQAVGFGPGSPSTAPLVTGTPSLNLRAQWSSASAILMATGTTTTHWVIVGDLA